MIWSHRRSCNRQRLTPVELLGAFGGWLAAAALVGPAATRMESTISRLASEMGLRSAQVIAFPQSRRRRHSPVLNLSQRAVGKTQQPRPWPSRPATPRVDRR